MTDLPAPADPAAAPRVLVAELRELLGETRCAGVCAELLAGGEPADYVGALAFLGGRAGPLLVAGSWAPYWGRVWGARGLLYVWDSAVARVVVRGIADPHWRVAEMCLKVSALRELAEAGDPAVPLVHHELPRVRANALRTLGLVGDTEHVDVVDASRDDEEPMVRRAAALAMRRLTTRLDLPGRP